MLEPSNLFFLFSHILICSKISINVLNHEVVSFYLISVFGYWSFQYFPFTLKNRTRQRQFPKFQSWKTKRPIPQTRHGVNSILSIPFQISINIIWSIPITHQPFQFKFYQYQFDFYLFQSLIGVGTQSTYSGYLLGIPTASSLYSKQNCHGRNTSELKN